MEDMVDLLITVGVVALWILGMACLARCYMKLSGLNVWLPKGAVAMLGLGGLFALLFLAVVVWTSSLDRRSVKPTQVLAAIAVPTLLCWTFSYIKHFPRARS